MSFAHSKRGGSGGRSAPGRLKLRRNLTALAVFAAGAVAGAVLEEVLARRLVRRPGRPKHIEPLPGRTFEVRSFDGTSIAVHVYGPEDATRTIVFSHGAIETHLLWHNQVRELLADGGYRLIACDARGHGASGAPRGPDGNTPFTGYTLARDLVAVVDQFARDRALLVGHSLGGMTIQALWHHGEITHIRDHVAGIVLVDSTYTSDLQGWRRPGTIGERLFERFEDVVQRIPLPAKVVDRIRPRTNDLTLFLARFVYGKDPSPEDLALSVHMYEKASSDTFAAFIDLADFDVHDSLQLIDVPALVIAGANDLVTPLHLSKEIAARIPDAELVVWEDCGHTVPLERHEEFTANVRKFAERVLP